MSALPLPPPRPQAALPPAPQSGYQNEMAPRTSSALGPLHHSLKGGGNYLPERPSWTEFIVPATDAKGHSHNERIAMSPMLSAEIENIVASRVFPYRRVGEFWRHAAMKLLAWLRDIEPGMQSSYYGALLAEQDILKEEQIKQNTEQTIKRQDEQLNLLLDRGDEEEAAALAYRLGRQLAHLPPTSWKRRYERTFTRKYGQLAEEGRLLAEVAYLAETQPTQMLPIPSLQLVATDTGYSLPEPAYESTAPALPLPTPWPVLANDGQPLVEPEDYSWLVESSITLSGFTGPTPEEIASSMMFGAPAGLAPAVDLYTPSYQDDSLVDEDGHETEYYESVQIDYGG